MNIVGRKVSFAVVVALILGWGILLWNIFQASGVLLEAEGYSAQNSSVIRRGIKMSFQVDRRVYAKDDTVLFALRNDSKKEVFVPKPLPQCGRTWWFLERLGDDGQTWSRVNTPAPGCEVDGDGLESVLGKHILSGNWIASAPTATYRMVVRYQFGRAASQERWTEDTIPFVATPSFTVQ